MARLQDYRAEKEANDIAARFANSSDIKSDMGRAYGFDFSGVNMHDGGTSGIATTAGSDIYFGAGILSQNTPQANMVKGHELTHVMQQSGAPGMESVPYGTEQNFSFLGMFRTLGNFFKNLFTRRRPTAPPQDMQAAAVLEEPEAANENDTGAAQTIEEAPETAVNNAPEEVREENMAAVMSPGEELEKEQLYEQLRGIDFPINKYVQGLSMNELRTFVDKRITAYKLEHGGVMEGYKETDRQAGNTADITDAQLAELRTKDFFNNDMESVARTQREQGVQNTVNRNSLVFTKFSRGLYYADMLVRNTPYGKTLYNKLEAAGKKEHWTRLYRSFRPVFLGEKGNFISDKDRDNHEWNMQFIRDIAGNEGTTSIASLMDEIVDSGNIVDRIVDSPEEAKNTILYWFNDIARLDLLGFTVDQLGQTDAFKKYIRIECGGVEPKSKDEWPSKVKYADAITTMVSNISAYISQVERDNGLYKNNFDTEFIMPDRGQPQTDEFTLEKLREMINASKNEYNAAKNEYRAKK